MKPLDPFVLIAQVGGGSHSHELRSIAQTVINEGPLAYVQRMAATADRSEGSRLWLGKPAGHAPFTRFPADDLIDSASFPKLARWVEELPYALWWLTHCGSMQEVIVHLGSVEDDEDFIAREHNPGAWLERLTHSWTPYLRAGCSICFDSGSDTKADSLAGVMLEWLRRALDQDETAILTRMYVEPRPQRQLMARLGTVGVFGINWTLHRANPDLYDDADRRSQMASDEECGGEIICQIDNPKRQPAGFPIFDGNPYTRYKWLGPATVWAIENGMTPAFSWWRETGNQRQDIIGNIREAAAKVGYAPPPEEKR